MAGPLLEFDPVSEDAGNSPLEVWDTGEYAVTEFDAPAPPLQVQWAGSVDTEGSLPSSRKHENRQITLTIEVETADALRALQAKVAKIAREGGTLKWTLPADDEVVVFDLHAADTFEPQLDILYFQAGGEFCIVKIALIARPYGRGPEVTGTVHTGTNGYCVFVETDIKGDIPALGRLRVTTTDPEKTIARWAIQSEHYSNASTAELVWEAEAATIRSGGSVTTGPSGAFGGASNNIVRASNVGTSGVAVFTLSKSGGSLPTGLGSYRVFARVQASSSNTGIVSVRATWRNFAGPSRAVENPWTAVVDADGAALEGTWALVDLGLLRLNPPPPRANGQALSMTVHAVSTVAADDIDFDAVFLFPVDEGYGDGFGVMTTGDAFEITHQDAQLNFGVWADFDSYVGSYLLVPPSGPEGRSVRVLAMLAGPTSDSSANRTSTVVEFANTQAPTAALHYTPRYLVVPEP